MAGFHQQRSDLLPDLFGVREPVQQQNRAARSGPPHANVEIPQTDSFFNTAPLHMCTAHRHLLVTISDQITIGERQMTSQEGTSTMPGHLEVTGQRVGDLFDAACPTRLLLDRVGSKWTVMIVLVLAEGGETRFGGLRRRMPGVSQKMLTQTLRQLENDGLASRRVEATSPPSVHYSLTPLGSTLVPPLRALKQWAEQHMALVETAHL